MGAPEVWFPNLGIEIHELDTVAFELFGRTVYWYGFLICIGVILAAQIAIFEIWHRGESEDDYLNVGVVGLIVSVIFSRLYYVIFSWDYYKNHLDKIFAIREGGLAVYGGVIGAILTAYIWTRMKKRSFLELMDIFIPGFPIAQAIGRWGNFFNREAFGGYSNGLFAMRYIADQAKSVSEELMDKAIYARGATYIQVHPTFLYECIWNVCVFIVLMIFRHKKKFEGQLTAMYLIGYGCGRIWIEGLRTDQLLVGSTNIAASQVLSGILIVIGILLFYFGLKKIKIKKSLNITEKS
ncbi:MAG: prolipoprotein diacylglyceryl transferase [Firmicutes bacterium]|nr:prolipoprotein diacylglyceryl transferase [Bacillota bacterium]MBR0104918.1 prolipoprotein diacylglyceryl transferase [Bacillota bacterium]